MRTVCGCYQGENLTIVEVVSDGVVRKDFGLDGDLPESGPGRCDGERQDQKEPEDWRVDDGTTKSLLPSPVVIEEQDLEVNNESCHGKSDGQVLTRHQKSATAVQPAKRWTFSKLSWNLTRRAG